MQEDAREDRSPPHSQLPGVLLGPGTRPDPGAAPGTTRGNVVGTHVRPRRRPGPLPSALPTAAPPTLCPRASALVHPGNQLVSPDAPSAQARSLDGSILVVAAWAGAGHPHGHTCPHGASVSHRRREASGHLLRGNISSGAHLPMRRNKNEPQLGPRVV